MTPRPTILALAFLACTPQASSDASSTGDTDTTSDTTTEAPPCDDGPARALS